MENKKSPFRIIWSVFMVLFYLCIAILLIFTPIFAHVALYVRIIMAVLFFVYGLFRAYRMWREM